MKNRRLSSLLVVGALALSGLTALATAGPATAGRTADSSTFAERWCSSGVARPCVESAFRNGDEMNPGDPVEVQMIGILPDGDRRYTELLIVNPEVGHPDQPLLTDEFTVTMNLGARLRPDTIESYASRPDVDRLGKNSAGQYLLRVTAKPVLLTTGCNDNYPNVCTDVAKSQAVTFDFTIIQQLVNLDLANFDRAQSADTVNGIFLVEGAGGDYLESEWGNSRYLVGGAVRAKASARFRIPYAMLISSFKIPAPSTMVASSVVGTVNGLPATYEFSQDPDGGGVFVDISGVTFGPGTGATRSALAAAAARPRVIRVKKGNIKPTRPIIERVTRTAPRRARITFLRAKPRGAYVTGYQARCVSSGRPTVFVSGKYPTIVVTGLRAGTKYSCSVRAHSRAGAGAWSLPKRV